MMTINPILVWPDPPSPALAQALDFAGYRWKAVGSVEIADKVQPDGGWPVAIVVAEERTTEAFGFVRDLRNSERAAIPVLVVLAGLVLGDLETRDELFEDFLVAPFHPREFEARLRHLLWRSDGGSSRRNDLVEYGPLLLNLDTYQAAISGHPLDLTYMEYELLKFLAQHPGRVFTRENLLSSVWGYDYYGGARTVDVHIRRLRAKLGEEHANLIHTVRSVGYRFGESHWSF